MLIAESNARKRSRTWKFFSYYRPYLGLLLTDLFCAVIVSAVALVLPLCARYT
jgi:ATP-binding cassette subfamily B protein